MKAWMLSGLVLAGGCMAPLQARLTSLEATVADQQRRIDALQTAQMQAARPDPRVAQVVGEQLQQAVVVGSEARIDQVAAVVAAQPGAERYLRMVASARDQIAMRGEPLSELTGVTALQGDLPDLSKGLTVLMFWEVWCPHCQRELPRMDQWWAAGARDEVQAVGITTLSRGVPQGRAEAFLRDNDITMPIGVSDGLLNVRVGVQGVPVSVVVRDGVILWKGHPAQLDGTMLRAWLTGSDTSGAAE